MVVLVLANILHIWANILQIYRVFGVFFPFHPGKIIDLLLFIINESNALLIDIIGAILTPSATAIS